MPPAQILYDIHYNVSDWGCQLRLELQLVSRKISVRTPHDSCPVSHLYRKTTVAVIGGKSKATL
jgi:hypothetical protein